MQCIWTDTEPLGKEISGSMLERLVIGNAPHCLKLRIPWNDSVIETLTAQPAASGNICCSNFVAYVLVIPRQRIAEARCVDIFGRTRSNGVRPSGRCDGSNNKLGRQTGYSRCTRDKEVAKMRVQTCDATQSIEAMRNNESRWCQLSQAAT